MGSSIERSPIASVVLNAFPPEWETYRVPGRPERHRFKPWPLYPILVIIKVCLPCTVSFRNRILSSISPPHRLIGLE